MSKQRDSKKQVTLIQLFVEQSHPTQLPSEIHVVPTGEWAHPVYGPMIITAADITEFKKNFDDKVRRDIPITVGHDNGMNGGELPAVGWFTEAIDRSDLGLKRDDVQIMLHGRTRKRRPHRAVTCVHGAFGRSSAFATVSEAAMQTADDIIRLLALEPHPEGGHFRETFRDPRAVDGRAASTAIYFLLRRGERSHWHRVDAVEIWHFHAGAPLELQIADDGGTSAIVVGADLAAGHRPQAVVPARAWQSAVSLGDWTLVGCTVAPGFEFSGFELAPEGWSPPPAE